MSDNSETMKVICQDRLRKSRRAAPEGRVVSSVVNDIDKLLAPKSYDELERLEGQIRKKLDSNEPIDVDYWEQLLRSLTVWKAKATLRKVYQSVIDSRLKDLRVQQEEEAQNIRQKLQVVLEGLFGSRTRTSHDSEAEKTGLGGTDAVGSTHINVDPEPLLKIRGEDKGLEVLDEQDFIKSRVCSIVCSVGDLG